MNYETILYEIDNEIAIITINRPKVLNALNAKVAEELDSLIQDLNKRDNIRVIILTGCGDKAFIAGADIASMKDMDPLQSRKFSRQLQKLTMAFEISDKIIIAAVNGFALGGGTEIAIACDFIYASNNAKFGQPEINLGIIPGAGGTQRLSRLIGKNWAKELCLSGEIIDASMAKEIGIVNKIFPPEKLMKETKKIAKKIASKGSVSSNAIKELVNFGYDLPLDHALRLEAEAFGLCFASLDQKEGMNAFLEKRKAVFSKK